MEFIVIGISFKTFSTFIHRWVVSWMSILTDLHYATWVLVIWTNGEILQMIEEKHVKLCLNMTKHLQYVCVAA